MSIKMPDWLRLTAAGPRVQLPDGRALRLLTAQEVLEARREAFALAGEDRELALCSNACLVARTVIKRGRRAYRSGADVLERCSVEEIQALARRWAAFDRAENPGLSAEQGRVERLKKAWSTCRSSAFGGMCSKPLGPFRRKNE